MEKTRFYRKKGEHERENKRPMRKEAAFLPRGGGGGREKKSGVIYASLGTRLYLSSPCELFYIGDLIRSNKSQHTHTYSHSGPSHYGIVNIFSLQPHHPRLNKSRLWCITGHIFHVVYRSKICKQTAVIKVIDAQMDPCSMFSFHLSHGTKNPHLQMSNVASINI